MNFPNNFSDFSSSYFNQITKPFSQWGRVDVIRITSIFIATIFVIVGLAHILRYAAKTLTGKVQNDPSSPEQIIDNKVVLVANKISPSFVSDNKTIEDRKVAVTSTSVDVPIEPPAASTVSSMLKEEDENLQNKDENRTIDSKALLDEIIEIGVAVSENSSTLHDDAKNDLFDKIEVAMQIDPLLKKYRIKEYHATVPQSGKERDLHLLFFSRLHVRVNWDLCNQFVQKKTANNPNLNDIVVPLELFSSYGRNAMEDPNNEFSLKTHCHFIAMDVQSHESSLSKYSFGFNDSTNLNHDAIAKIVEVIRQKVIGKPMDRISNV